MSNEWTGPEAETIAAELARVVLGGRGPDRPEQRMDALGSLVRMAITHRLSMSSIAVTLLPAIQATVDSVGRVMRQIQAAFDQPREIE